MTVASQAGGGWWRAASKRHGNYHPNGDPTDWAFANEGALSALLARFISETAPAISHVRAFYGWAVARHLA
jgi:hypothetical protein